MNSKSVSYNVGGSETAAVFAFNPSAPDLFGASSSIFSSTSPGATATASTTTIPRHHNAWLSAASTSNLNSGQQQQQQHLHQKRLHSGNISSIGETNSQYFSKICHLAFLARKSIRSFLVWVLRKLVAILSAIFMGTSRSPTTSFSSSSAAACAVRNVAPLDVATAQRFPDNTVINSRYTKWNFIPMNLYEQFKKPLNFYFLLVAALQFISVIAPVNPLSTLLPLLFAFSLTAAKEGYDDWRRHAQDAQYNSKKYVILDPGAAGGPSWVPKSSADIRIGDVIRLRSEEEIPCDIVSIAAPATSSGTVYIRTDNLDGENDLKPRDVVPLLRFFSAERTARLSSLREGVSVDGCIDAGSVSISDLCEVLKYVTLVCPPPSAALDSFDARVDVLGPSLESASQKSSISLSIAHLLPQSCSIRHTSDVIAIVVYTGNETRCGMNKHDAPMKWAKIDQSVSSYSKIIFVCQLISAFIMGLIGYSMNEDTESKGMWYLGTSSMFSGGTRFIIYQLRFFLLTTVMIPVSFKFVVDLSKHFMALVLEWDLAMVDDRTGEGMKVRNSSIVEDLGQIEYVLSDKTGTMTENRMVLRHISVGGAQIPVVVGSEDGGGVGNGTVNTKVTCSNEVTDFCVSALLCNSVEVDEAIQEGHSVAYHGASPDEEAICTGILSFGFVLVHRDKTNVKIRTPSGTVRSFVVLRVFPFSSEKKCMAIFVREVFSQGIASERGEEQRQHDNTVEVRDEVIMIIKGADDKIFSLAQVSPDDRRVSLHALNDHLRDFACYGLRTLLFAKKRMSRAEYDRFDLRYLSALNEVQGRKQLCDTLESEVENGVDVIGCSAIEDKLQDDVKETIEDLITANVRVWMLTGDKIETAVQIARSCGLLHRHDPLLSLIEPAVASDSTSSDSPPAAWIETLMNTTLASLQISVRNAHIQHGSGISSITSQAMGTVDCDSDSDTSNDALVTVSGEEASYGTTGSTRNSGMSSALNLGGFVVLVQGGPVLDQILGTTELLIHFKTLAFHAKTLICARVTPSQKARIADLVRSSGYMTLAIGDGGNDVAMIQQAHVGVGICGKEGTQASRAADFSVSRFSHLRSLMLYHGHSSYARTSYVVQYSFYKSMFISFIQLVFNVFSTHMSGASFWNSFALTMWNGVYTLPQTLAYCLDRPAPRRALEKNPSLYRFSQNSGDFNRLTFFGFVIRGVVQAAALFWLVSGVVGSSSVVSANQGSGSSQDVSFTVAYSAMMLHQVFTVILESHTLTIVNLIFILGMPLFYYVTVTIYSDVKGFAYYGVFRQTDNIVGFLQALAIAAALFLPHFTWTAFLAWWSPRARDVMRQKAIITRQSVMIDESFPLHGSGLRLAARKFLQTLKRHWVPEDPSLYAPCSIQHHSTAVV